MTDALIDRFTSPVTMMAAEQELFALGSAAVPMVRSVLDGTSTNEFGVPYRQLGLPLRCALEVAMRLGPLARPLEPLLRAELRRGNFTAAQALGALGSVDDDSIEALAEHLDDDLNQSRGFAHEINLAPECASALCRLGHADHPVVVKTLERSPRAATEFARMQRYLQRRS